MNESQNYPLKINGEALFTDDIYPDDYIYGLTIRSKIPCGKIASIKIPPIPEGYILVDHKNIPGNNSIKLFDKEIPLLAERNVNYIGEPILLLGGPDKLVLKDISDEIVIEYKEEKAFLDLDKTKKENILDTYSFSKGDFDSVLAGNFHVEENSYYTGGQEHLNLEPQSAIAIKEKDSLLIYSSTLDPFMIVNSISEILKLPKKKLRIIVPNVCSPLGGKLFFSIFIAGHAALLSSVACKSVKLLYTREEDIFYSFKRHPNIIKIKTITNNKGNLLGMKLEINLDTGAYKTISKNMLKATLFSFIRNYACDNILIKANIISTNKVPAGYFNGYDETQLYFAMELHTSKTASSQEMDPYLWKKKNIKIANRSNNNKSNILPVEAIDAVVEMSDFIRKYSAYESIRKMRKNRKKFDAPLRGIGLSICAHCQGPIELEENTNYGITLRLGKDKKLYILTSLVNLNNNLAQYFTSIAIATLNFKISEVVIEKVDTKVVPDSGPTISSDTIPLYGKLIKQGCISINQKKKKNILPLTLNKKLLYVKKDKQNNQNNLEIVCPFTSWEATVVEIEVNPVTLQVIPKGIWIVLASENPFCEEKVKEQIEASALANLGFASMEVLEYSKGHVCQKNLSEYTIPGITDLPEIKVKLIYNQDKSESDIPSWPGNQVITGVAPAYISSIVHATGYNCTQIPLTPEKMHEYLYTPEKSKEYIEKK